MSAPRASSRDGSMYPRPPSPARRPPPAVQRGDRAAFAVDAEQPGAEAAERRVGVELHGAGRRARGDRHRAAERRQPDRGRRARAAIHGDRSDVVLHEVGGGLRRVVARAVRDLDAVEIVVEPGVLEAPYALPEVLLQAGADRVDVHGAGGETHHVVEVLGRDGVVLDEAMRDHAGRLLGVDRHVARRHGQRGVRQRAGVVAAAGRGARLQAADVDGRAGAGPAGARRDLGLRAKGENERCGDGAVSQSDSRQHRRLFQTVRPLFPARRYLSGDSMKSPPLSFRCDARAPPAIRLPGVSRRRGRRVNQVRDTMIRRQAGPGFARTRHRPHIRGKWLRKMPVQVMASEGEPLARARLQAWQAEAMASLAREVTPLDRRCQACAGVAIWDSSSEFSTSAPERVPRRSVPSAPPVTP